jgi:acyl CoA:acetate/3-ketoacid CoA transferase beta subunit
LLRVTDRGLVVKELRADVALEDVEKITDARLLVEGEIKAMVF